MTDDQSDRRRLASLVNEMSYRRLVMYSRRLDEELEGLLEQWNEKFRIAREVARTSDEEVDRFVDSARGQG